MYDTTFHGFTEMTPFRVVYGRESPPFLRLVKDESKIKKVKTMIKKRNLILDELKDNLKKLKVG